MHDCDLFLEDETDTFDQRDAETDEAVWRIIRAVHGLTIAQARIAMRKASAYLVSGHRVDADDSRFKRFEEECRRKRL